MKGNKVDSKTALKTAKIPLETLSQIPELQLHPLLWRIIEIARDDIGEGMIDFNFFYGLLKVFTSETDVQTKKKFMFRFIDVTGDGIITRREFVLFFINVFCNRNHFAESENDSSQRRFSINNRQINEMYQNIDNVLSGTHGTSEEGRVRLDMNREDDPGSLLGGPTTQINADMQLSYKEFDKLVTDHDAYQFLTLEFI